MDEYQTPELEEGQSLRVRFHRKRRKPRWLIALLVFVLPILVGAAVILLAGEPGIGKSTLLLDVAAQTARGAGGGGPRSVLYLTGEESAAQVRCTGGPSPNSVVWPPKGR